MTKKIIRLKSTNNFVNSTSYNSATGVLKIKQTNPVKKGIGKLFKATQTVNFPKGTSINKITNPRAGIVVVDVRKKKLR